MSNFDPKMTDQSTPTVAIIPWGDVWEDFYGTLAISFETFRQEFTGSWQFKFIKADIFEEGEDSGALIVPFNDAAAFAQALGRLIEDPLLRQALGKRAQQRAMQFSAKRVGKHLKSLLIPRLGEPAPRIAIP